MLGFELTDKKDKEKEKRVLEDILAQKNEDLAKVRKELDEADSRWKVENQYAVGCKRQYKYLEKKLLNHNWATDEEKKDFIWAIKETEKFVNDDRYDNRFLGEVQDLKDKKRFADNELRKEKER